MRLTFWWAASVLSWSGVAWAQVDPCAAGQGNICVGFSNGAQGVPLSPQAMAVLVGLVLLFAYVKLRKNAGGLFSVGLSVCLVAWMALQTGGVGWANGYDRAYTRNGSPAVSPVNNGPLVLVNDLPLNVTITSITVNGVPYSPSGPTDPSYADCFVGKVLVPTTGGVTGMCVVSVDS